MTTKQLKRMTTKLLARMMTRMMPRMMTKLNDDKDDYNANDKADDKASLMTRHGRRQGSALPCDRCFEGATCSFFTTSDKCQSTHCYLFCPMVFVVVLVACPFLNSCNSANKSIAL